MLGLNFDSDDIRYCQYIIGKYIKHTDVRGLKFKFDIFY